MTPQIRTANTTKSKAKKSCSRFGGRAVKIKSYRCPVEDVHTENSISPILEAFKDRGRLPECEAARGCARTLSVRCPLHHDSNPSASLSLSTDGKVLFRCHARHCGEQSGQDKIEMLANKLHLSKSQFFDVDDDEGEIVSIESPKKAASPKHEPTDFWNKKSKLYQKKITEDDLTSLSNQTGVPVSALKQLHVGLRTWKKNSRQCSSFTFPEVDAAGVNARVKVQRVPV